METTAADPAALFREVAATHDRCFWLDGGGGRDWSGRRSLVGWLGEDDVSLTYDATTRRVTRLCSGRETLVGDDVFAALEAELAADPPGTLWIGYFGYASRADLPARTSSDGMPDAIWMRCPDVVVVDHEPCASDPAVVRQPPSATRRRPPRAYRDAFAAVQEQLRTGNSYEVNLTYRHVIEDGLDPVSAYLRLRELNPAPYAGVLRHGDSWLLSSSPERYATIGPDGVLETRPIKGTSPRAGTPAADEASRQHLATDARFRAENLMIVDLLRNDVGSVSRPGTVEVPALMAVESYPSVHQLVSTVRGRLRPEVGTVGALRALFPPGSMTGAPKRRTMEIIDSVEATPRGAYSGAFGWISSDGAADLGVVIRSLTTVGDGCWNVGTGGGITVLSEADDEYAETAWKVDRLVRVFRSACPDRAGEDRRSKENDA